MVEMEELYREVSEKVSNSIAIVRSRGLYCIGSVVHSTVDTTLILTSSSLIRKDTQIDVHFHDNTVAPARTLVVGDRFTLLAVESRVACSVIQFSEKDIDIVSEALVLSPTSVSTLSHIPSFVIQPSCAARDDKMVNIQESEQYFLISCHYGGSIDSGYHNILVSAPVFDMSGKTIGLVTSQCGEEKNKVDIKIGLSASNARKSFLDLLEKSKQQEKVARSPEENKKQERVAETGSSAGPSTRKRKLRRLG
uniref:Uncharacterized protein n=1 Tax=Avena sativa TaxID=4498 RepID=A0ACD5Y7P0_AVESA